MIHKTEYKRVNKLLGKGTKVYLDPSTTPGFEEYYLETLPLITDRTLCFCNDTSHFSDRFCEFVNEGFLIPVVTDEKTLPDEIYKTGNYISRRDIFKEQPFQYHYNSLVKNLKQNKRFRWSVEKATSYKGEKLENEISKHALILPWDIILAQVLEVPIIINPLYEQLLLQTLKTLSFPYHIPSIATEHVTEVKTFLNKISIMIPQNLPVQKIKRFREESVRKKLIDFIERGITGSQNKNFSKPMMISENLVNEFNILSRRYNQYQEAGSSILPLIGATLGGIYGLSFSPEVSVVTGSAGTVLGLGLNKARKELVKRVLPNRWVLLLQEPIKF